VERARRERARRKLSRIKEKENKKGGRGERRHGKEKA